MIYRCYRKANKDYINYGGRGITVYDKWRDNFLNFRKWALSNGYKENLTINRIDNNKNYCPDNCNWISNIEQQSNKRNNQLLTFNNKTQTIAKWSKEIGINFTTIVERLRMSWSIEKTLSTPTRKYK